VRELLALVGIDRILMAAEPESARGTALSMELSAA
jgi:hypothetical protein